MISSGRSNRHTAIGIARLKTRTGWPEKLVLTKLVTSSKQMRGALSGGKGREGVASCEEREEWPPMQVAALGPRGFWRGLGVGGCRRAGGLNCTIGVKGRYCPCSHLGDRGWRWIVGGGGRGGLLKGYMKRCRPNLCPRQTAVPQVENMHGATSDG